MRNGTADGTADKPASRTDDEELVQTLTCPLDYIRWGASYFGEAGLAFGHGSDNPVDEAAHLVLHALSLAHDLPDTYLQGQLTDAERRAIVELLRARVTTRKPAAYLTGTAWFAGLAFYVDERVIIPRSPIAELIGDGFQPWLAHREPLAILDLCAGCGAIAIACAELFPDARVVASDASTDALDVARTNATRHDSGPQVELVQADLFDDLPAERFDLIVTNPPYVSREESEGLAAEYQHEPGYAFHGNQQDLSLLTRLLVQAPDYLTEDGLLILEVGARAFELEATHPDLPISWVELQHGGMGVGVLEAEDLAAWASAQTIGG
ncbi:50S ribosomal protein L3 N(5)-glutamine methyltransferase [Salinisphaera sp. USBA-960]|uniref:50S ribosomal protein L3 N(5)-glutamine methyltransferase n=1 Tax=Salinisphaera orenii TaxID=856731 RepID=UPI000DBE687D|nr:50S ribosomal protein L3 N(5)-glutamine methyltransferase [Salifodinibacter halophilus]NNC26088.1 50S ribosomal protein L3 N(5)-glutamine methyltransferase [Salifodinibacter halophilus]